MKSASVWTTPSITLKLNLDHRIWVRRTGMELSADIVVGDSGGPVIDASGAVVGIVYANSKSRPDIGFATDDEELRDLLAGLDASVGEVSTQRCI